MINGGDKMIEKSISRVYKMWATLSLVKKATLVYLFCTILQKTITIFSTPLFTRLMNTAEYGQFTVYQSWLSLFAIITTFRLDYDVFNKGMTEFEDKSSYVSTMQITTSFFTLCALFLYFIFHDKINTLIELPPHIIVSIFIELFFMSSISFWSLKERYEFKYRNFAIVTLTMAFFNIFIGVISVYFSCEKGIARILSCVAIQVVFGFVFYIINFKNASKAFNYSYAKFAVVFNIPLIPHYFSSYILNFADKLMIQKMVGISEAGIYGVVYSAGLVMTMVSSALTNTLIPWQYKSLKENQFGNIKKHVNGMMFILMVVLTLFVLLAPEFMKVLASREYYEGVYVIPPVASSTLFIFLYNLVCNAEFFYNKNKFTMMISGVAALLNIILNYFFIRLFGYIAAGYTTLFCYAVVAFLHVVYLNRLTMRTIDKKIYDLKSIVIFVIYMFSLSAFSTILYRYIILRYIIVASVVCIGLFFKNRILTIIKG